MFRNQSTNNIEARSGRADDKHLIGASYRFHFDWDPLSPARRIPALKIECPEKVSTNLIDLLLSQKGTSDLFVNSRLGPAMHSI
jgi:hypothetical protein